MPNLGMPAVPAVDVTVTDMPAVPAVDETTPDLRAYGELAFPPVPAELVPAEVAPAVRTWPVEPDVADEPPAPRRKRRPNAFAVAGVAVVIGAGVTMITIGWNGSGPPQPPKSTSLNAPVPVVNTQPMSRALPVRITIPKIHVDAPVEALGQNADGTVEVPTLTRPNLAGWYKYGPTPGQKGAAVVLGHVDAHRQQAVFFRLGSLRKGDHINIARAGGSVAKFVVDSVVPVPKDEFPTQSVYGKTKYAALRVITCGGKYDKKTMHYLSNIIVYAHLVH
jgi:LPXTG-site transpeptidase (sortase) family protein